MDGGRIAIVAVVALVVGLGGGYILWGARAASESAELARVQARLSQLRQGGGPVDQLTAKIQELETQAKQTGEELAKETELRERLEKLLRAKRP